MMVLHKRTVIILTMLFCAMAFGQVKERPSSLDKAFEQQQNASTVTKDDLTSKFQAVPMEGPVNSDRYVVGPSDIFQLGLWGPFSITYPLTVTPEGTVIVPTVGEVMVSGLKLSEAKKRVFEKVRTKYLTGDVTLTLIKPRSIVVTLRGTVLRQGQYVLTAVDRVEKLLSLGANVESTRPNLAVQPMAPGSTEDMKGEYTKAPKIAQVEEIYDRASMRNILLMRKNGDTVRVDIPRFYATGDERCNPFLVEGDIVFVPQRNLSRNSVGVYGAVNSPGRYEFVEKDSLAALVQVAQGAAKEADLEHVRIERVNDRGEMESEIEVNLAKVLQGMQPDVALVRGDRVVVSSIPDSRGVYAVTIAGEVKKPGMYPILRTGTKLSRILQEAGGFKENALLSGAVILRHDDDEKDLFGPQVYYLRSLRSGQFTVADSAYFNMDIRISRHPVVADFTRLIQSRDTTQDVTLRDDDIIYVPANNMTVLVHGQVQNPGYVPYVPGMGYKYYIEKAGGYSELAVTGDTKVIKKATLDWVDPSDTAIQPGDQIWAPKKPVRDFLSYTYPILRDILVVTASLATAAILGVQVFR